MKVVDVMAKNPLTVEPSDTIGQADELMYENKIRQLPVVDENRPVGIITDRDIRSFLGGPAAITQEEREIAVNTKIRPHYDHRTGYTGTG
jgi:CBS domain-containing protein